MQEGHYSWLAVMVPLMLLVGGYVMLMIVDIVGDFVVVCFNCHKDLESKVNDADNNLLS